MASARSPRPAAFAQDQDAGAAPDDDDDATRSSSPARASPRARGSNRSRPSTCCRQRGTDLAGHHRARRGAVERRALARLPAPGDHRRHRPHPPRHPARPRARPDAGAGERQAPPPVGAGQRQRLDRPRLGRRRPQRDPDSPPSSPSRCCATAPRRSTAPTPSPASSTCACAKRARAAAPASPTASTTPTSRPRAAHRHADGRRDADRVRLEGLPLGAEGFLTLSGEYRDRDPTSRGDFDNRVPGSPRHLALRRSRSQRHHRSTSTPARRSNDAGASTAGPATRTATATPPPSRASSTTPRNVPAIYPNGFLPLITTDIDDFAVGWGVQGRARRLGRRRRAWSTARNQIDYGVEQHAQRLATARRRRRSFDAGGMNYDQCVFERRRRTRASTSGSPRPLNVALRHRGAARGLLRSTPASRPPTIAGPWASARRRAGLPGLPAGQRGRRSTATPTAPMSTSKRRSPSSSSRRSPCAASTTRTSARRVTGKLSGALRLHACLRAARHGLDRLPRAGAAAAVLHLDLHQLHQRRDPFEVGTFPATVAIAPSRSARKPLEPRSRVNYSLGAVFRLGALRR